MLCILLFCFAGCSSTAPKDGVNPSKTAAVTESKPEESLSTADPIEKSPKMLVAYYSATGSTEKAAKLIAEYTGADVFAIVPKEEYTSEDLDWTNEKARVFAEHENEAARTVALVKTTVEDFDQYDTVFVGYPIWWGIAAWPVNTFVKSNDFTGKTVIPFCTSASSGLGESGELLKEMAGTGDWLEGKRFSSGVSQKDIEEWIQRIKAQL